RQDNREGSALAFAGAVRPDRPAVQVDQVLYDRQAESQASGAPGVRQVRLAERVENVRQDLRVNADACIRNSDLSIRTGATHPHDNTSALSRELDCVPEQVPDDLL